jgi:hypothetical protein
LIPAVRAHEEQPPGSVGAPVREEAGRGQWLPARLLDTFSFDWSILCAIPVSLNERRQWWYSLGYFRGKCHEAID